MLHRGAWQGLSHGELCPLRLRGNLAADCYTMVEIGLSYAPKDVESIDVTNKLLQLYLHVKW